MSPNKSKSLVLVLLGHKTWIHFHANPDPIQAPAELCGFLKPVFRMVFDTCEEGNEVLLGHRQIMRPYSPHGNDLWNAHTTRHWSCHLFLAAITVGIRGCKQDISGLTLAKQDMVLADQDTPGLCSSRRGTSCRCDP